MPSRGDKIPIQNILSPGHVRNVDRNKYEAMRKAMLTVFDHGAPGITVAAAKKLILPLLPVDLYPGGDKAGWWMKAVQLDLEAKGTLLRERTKPLKLRRLKALA